MKKLILLLPILLLAAAACNPGQNKEQSGFNTSTIANFSFQYPSSWKTSTCTSKQAVDAETFTIPDCALFSPVDINSGPFIGVQKIKASIDEAIQRDGYLPDGIINEEMIIDGHKTVYIKTKTPEYSYIDNHYYIEDADSVVGFYFREYAVSRPEGAPEQIADNRQYSDEFHQMAKSIKFQ